MDSKPAQSQETPNQPQPKPVVKPKRNRRFSKEIISETSKELILRVKHTPYKGEKLSDTIRKDRKYDPTQKFYAGTRPL